MANCSECGDEAMTFECKYCGQKFCSSHRLPENHDCPDLEEEVEKQREETGKWFEEKDVREELKPPEPEKPSLFKDIARSLAGSATLSIILVTVSAFILHELFPAFRAFLQLSPALTQAALEATNQVAADAGFNSAYLTKTLPESPWTLVTVMLAHSGTFHIFANMVTFYFFGTPFERLAGARELLKFYIGAGVAASIGFIVFNNLVYQIYGPAVNGIPTLGPAVGASGAVVAVFAAVAMLYPDAEVLLYFFIPMKISTTLKLFMGFETIGLLSKLAGLTLPIIGNLAFSAHLTGLVIGVWYGRKLREKHRTKTGVLDLLGY